MAAILVALRNHCFNANIAYNNEDGRITAYALRYIGGASMASYSTTIEFSYWSQSICHSVTSLSALKILQNTADH